MHFGANWSSGEISSEPAELLDALALGEGRGGGGERPPEVCVAISFCCENEIDLAPHNPPVE